MSPRALWQRPLFWDFICCFSLVLSVLLIFHEVIFEQKGLIIESDDNLQLHIPLLTYLGDSLRKFGELDPWNPFIWGGGMPAIGNPNVPFNWLIYVLLKLERPFFLLALNYHIVVEFIVCAIGIFFLFKCLNYSRWQSLLAGILFIFSTTATWFLYATTLFFHFAVIPWVLIILLKKTKVWVSIFLLGFIFYFQFTYGQLQWAIYSWQLIGLCIVWIWRERLWNKRVITIFLSGLLFGALLASHFIFPLFDFLQTYPDRGEFDWADYTRKVKVPYLYLANLFIPQLFWNGFTYSVDVGKNAWDMGWWPLWHDGWSPSESHMVNSGMLLFALALFSCRALWRRSNDISTKIQRRWLILAFVIVWLCSTQVGSYVSLLLTGGKAIPFSRLSHLLIFPLLFLGITELDNIRRDRKVLLNFLLMSSGLLAALCLLSNDLVLRTFVDTFFTEAKTAFTRFFWTVDEFYVEKGANLKTILYERICIFLIIFAFVALALFKFHSPVQRNIYIGLAILTSLADSTLYQQTIRHQGRESFPYDETLRKESPLIQYIKNRPDLDRYFFYSMLGVKERVTGLTPNQNSYYRIPSINGYSSVVPRESILEPSFSRIDVGQIFLSPVLLRLLSVKYLLMPNPPTGSPKWFIETMEQKFSTGKFAIFEFRNSTPRFFFPKTIRPFGTHYEVASALMAWNASPEIRSASVGAVRWDRPTDCNPKFEMKEAILSHLYFEIHNPCSRDVAFALNIPDHHWWNAYLNNKPIVKGKLNLVHSVVSIPPGLHQLNIKVEAKSFVWGLRLSQLSWFVFVAGFLWFLIVNILFRLHLGITLPGMPTPSSC